MKITVNYEGLAPEPIENTSHMAITMLKQQTPSNIIFSCSNALNKWLKLDLPRIPSPNGKRVGTQPLTTNTETISWQCHVVENYYGSRFCTVIAVESYSRYTLLIPFNFPPTHQQLEQTILNRWANSLVSLMTKHGEISREDSTKALERIGKSMQNLKTTNIEWKRNTDLSVNGHVSDSEQWLLQFLEGKGFEELSDNDAFNLETHINSLFKRAKDPQGKKQQFYPVPRFVTDGIFRFMSNSEHAINPYASVKHTEPANKKNYR